MGFEARSVRIALADIQLLRPMPEGVRRTRKFVQIATSMREIGMVEPLVVAHDRSARGQYLLLDGHIRLEVLKDMGEAAALCLVATDDEAYTYNNRISRLAIIQEHRMIIKAIERGVSEERLAAVLNVDADNIRRKRRLLDGICPEVAALLEDKHVSLHAFWALKKMVPMRQIEAAELMVAMNKFTISYARTLLAATPDAQLVAAGKRRRPGGLSDEQLALMQRESANLDREFRLVEQSYGADHLDLVLAKGYLAKLLGNKRIARFLEQHHGEIFAEFTQIADRQLTSRHRIAGYSRASLHMAGPLHPGLGATALGAFAGSVLAVAHSPHQLGNNVPCVCGAHVVLVVLISELLLQKGIHPGERRMADFRRRECGLSSLCRPDNLLHSQVDRVGRAHTTRP
jgi:hypothetical protein